MSGAPATVAGREQTTYGLLRIGAAQVALPLTVLREVIPCPRELAPMPASARGLCGAVNLRDVVIPVLDLAVALDWPTSGRDDPVIVIISSGGRLLGIIADQVNGITTVADGQRHDTRDSAGELVFSHTFVRPEDGTVVSILDAEAILGRTGVPTVGDPADAPGGSPDSATSTVAPAGGRTQPMLLVRCGPFRMAVNLTDIHTVLPQLAVQSSPLENEACRGVTGYRGLVVPVVDLLHVVGLGATSDSAGAQGLLWRYAGGLVALQVCEVVEIVSVREDEIRPLPVLGVPDPRWFRGAARVAGHGQHLVLDPSVVSADETLAALGRLNTTVDGAESATGDPDGHHAGVTALNRYLTYRAGVEVATPLDQITEIVAYPDDVAPMGGAGGVVGLFTHRQHVVSLVSLGLLTGRGRPAAADGGRVLLVERDGEYAGFVVDALGAIEDSVWEEDPDRRVDRNRLLESSPLVQIGAEPDGRLLPRVDLVALVGELAGAVR